MFRCDSRNRASTRLLVDATTEKRYVDNGARHLFEKLSSHICQSFSGRSCARRRGPATISLTRLHLLPRCGRELWRPDCFMNTGDFRGSHGDPRATSYHSRCFFPVLLRLLFGDLHSFGCICANNSALSRERSRFHGKCVGDFPRLQDAVQCAGSRVRTLQPVIAGLWAHEPCPRRPQAISTSDCLTRTAWPQSSRHHPASIRNLPRIRRSLRLKPPQLPACAARTPRTILASRLAPCPWNLAQALFPVRFSVAPSRLHACPVHRGEANGPALFRRNLTAPTLPRFQQSD
jgi:hypothetical protein